MNYLNKFLCCASCALTISVANPAASNAAETTMATLKLYKTHCAECHNEKRLGAMGPALLPGNIKRLRKKAAVDIITNGRAATQMPAFSENLSEKGIKALVEYIYTPPGETPVWGLTEIRASHIGVTRGSSWLKKSVRSLRIRKFRYRVLPCKKPFPSVWPVFLPTAMIFGPWSSMPILPSIRPRRRGATVPFAMRPGKNNRDGQSTLASGPAPLFAIHRFTIHLSPFRFLSRRAFFEDLYGCKKAFRIPLAYRESTVVAVAEWGADFGMATRFMAYLEVDDVSGKHLS
jgi:cytochrome c553